MRSPAQAIVWEICAKSRWALLLAFGLIPFCALCEWITPPGHESIGVLQGFSAVTTFTSVIWICSYTANDSRGSFAGFPSWMYTLPLRTSALVIWPMLLGAVLMLLAVVAWEITIAAYWNRPLQFVQISWRALLAVVTLLCVQTFIWSLHRFRWTRIVVLVATIYGFFYVAVVGPLWKFPGGASLWFGAVALAIPLTVAGAVAGVTRDRRGLWQGWTTKLLDRFLDWMPHRSGPFASAGRAQLWFEWRRRGNLAVTIFGGMMACCVFMYVLPGALYLNPVQTLFCFSGPFIAMIFAGGQFGTIVGASDVWAKEFGVLPIVAVRPINTCGMVFAKMKAAAVIAVAGWLLFGILLVPIVYVSSHWGWQMEAATRFWPEFPVNYPKYWRWLTNPMVILALVVATWHTIVQSMAVVLTGSRRRMAWAMWQGLIILAAVVGFAFWLNQNREWANAFFRYLPFFTAAMMVLKARGTWRGFTAVGPLVSRREFSILVALWSLVAILVLAAGVFAHNLHGLPPALLWLFVLWQFFPAGEIPQCVVALASNRHR